MLIYSSFAFILFVFYHKTLTKTTFSFLHLLLLSQAKSKGFNSKYDIGVKFAEKQQRRFTPEKLREGRNIIGLQVGAAEIKSL